MSKLNKKYGPFDLYGIIGTIATLAFIAAYILVSVAAPIYLFKSNKLKTNNVLISLGSIIFLGIALEGSIYPIPPPPYNYLPYIFLGLIAIGIIWFLIARKVTPEIGENIKTDIKAIDKQYASLESANL